MLVRDTGEFELIEALANTLADGNQALIDSLTQRGFRLRLSIGDDAAAWEAPSGTTVLTTDTMVEAVHFDLEHIDWRDLGWKSLAANLSDIAAMGCLPTFSTVTLGLRGDLPVDGLVEMYEGMQDACRRYGGAVVGGDVVRSPVFFATVAMEGAAEVGVDGLPLKLLTRSSASPGDQIAVTGHLGCSGGGLRMMTQRLQFDEATSRHLKHAHNRPEPRVPQGAALAGVGANAAIDVSDGLVDDLQKLCKASGVGAVVQSHLVPVDGPLKTAYPDDWLALGLGGGEDYELLFTASADVIDRAIEVLDMPTTVIGHIPDETGEVTVVDRDGNTVDVARGGWDHFHTEATRERR